MQPLIRTSLKNEVLLNEPARERGSRYWSSVELPSRTWFVVAVYADGPAAKEVKHFVAISIDDAKQVQLQQEGVHSTQVFLAMHAPLHSVSGVIFELLEEAYLNATSGQYVYRLASGVTFSIDPPAGPPLRGQESPSELRLVYRRRR